MLLYLLLLNEKIKVKKSIIFLVAILFFRMTSLSQVDVVENSSPTSESSSELNLASGEEYFPTISQTELMQRSIAEANHIPYHTDEEIYAKLLSIPSSIPLSYTPEIAQIIRNYVYNKRDYLGRMLTASQIYFPIFEDVFIMKGLPTELKYLSIVESALNPCARSRCGATGLWQFMHRTAKDEGMCINSHIDERRDVYRSTEFAANYLNKLYTTHNDWFLALAAYNSGSGNVNKAIRNSLGYDFWSIKHRLPRETQSYVPTFIAVIYCMFYADEYKIYAGTPNFDFANTVKEKIYTQQSLRYLAELTGSFEEELMQYNPALKKGIIPETTSGYDLILPKQYSLALNNSRELFAMDPYIIAQPIQTVPEPDNTIIVSESYVKEPSTSGYASIPNNDYGGLTSRNTIKENKESSTDSKYRIVKVTEYVDKLITHRVKKGESLKEIGAKYSVSERDLKDWNQIADANSVEVGNSLIIHKKEKTVTPQFVINDGSQNSKKTISKEIANSGEKQIIHKIKKGETLMQLTRLYGVTLSQIKEWNFLNDLAVGIGQEIYIYTNQTAKSNTEEPVEASAPIIKNYSYYEVSKGDTLQIASLKLNVPIEMLKSLNNRDVNEPLKEGERIKVPAL